VPAVGCRYLYDYLIFVGCIILPLSWYMYENFMWFDFEFNPLPISIRDFSVLLSLLFVCSLLTPGIVVLNKSPVIAGVLLLGVAFSFSALEIVLHEQFTGIYPYAATHLAPAVDPLMRQWPCRQSCHPSIRPSPSSGREDDVHTHCSPSAVQVLARHTDISTRRIHGT
jgi:hypothetical protein